MTDKERMSSRELGLLLAQQLLDVEDLHYGLWDAGLEVYPGNVALAQQRYTAMLLALLERLLADSKQPRLLDVGCGKGYLMFDFTKVVPGIEVYGLDISEYAINDAKEEIKDRIIHGNATSLPYEDGEFDLVYSLNTLHNLHCFDLDKALREMNRVGKEKYLCVESYRNEKEKVNLLYWQVTCEAFNTPEEWDWWFKNCGYTGDHSFIYFE